MAMTTSPTHRSRAHPPGRRRGRDSADGQVLGVLLVVGGIGWFLQQAGIVSLSAGTMLSCLLIALGIGLVSTARRAGGGGLVVLGLALTVVLASISAVDTGLLQRGAGERTFAPATAGELEERYDLGVGSLTLDLTAIDADELQGEQVKVQMGVGELVVVLPPASEVAVDVHGRASAGDVKIFGRSAQHDGTNVEQRVTDELDEGEEALVLDLDVGLGTIEVVRPPAR